MKTFFLSLMITCSLLASFKLWSSENPKRDTPDTPSVSKHFLTTKSAKKHKIQMALLLDTSNSMDGLIDQAKAQLWKMVNQLAATQKDGEAPDIEIALFEYGNDQLAAGEGYVRLVTSLTTNLDDVSEKLFALRTNGGSEYCGWVIEDAVKNLKWSENAADLKIITVAGNEPFDQGPKDYKKTCQWAREKGIIVNTIFCGPWREGVETHWENGARIGKGKYLNIEQDLKVIHISTPYDHILIELNNRLNKTYIGFGSTGAVQLEKMQVQDANAASYGISNAATRASFKAKEQYQNADWDLVDAVKEKKADVSKVKTEELPEEMRRMSVKEREAYVQKKTQEREAIKKEILDVEKKIQQYTADEQKKNANQQTLDNVLIQAVMEQAKTKGFKN